MMEILGFLVGQFLNMGICCFSWLVLLAVTARHCYLESMKFGGLIPARKLLKSGIGSCVTPEIWYGCLVLMSCIEDRNIVITQALSVTLYLYKTFLCAVLIDAKIFQGMKMCCTPGALAECTVHWIEMDILLLLFCGCLFL